MSEEKFDLMEVEVPEYATTTALSTAMADEMFDDALSGLSMGFPPSIRTKQGRFRLVDSAGEETVLTGGDLEEGEYLPVIVLRAKRALSKKYYAKAYDPTQDDGQAPDCFSIDGEKPDPSVKVPLHTNCAGCEFNAFGSGRNQNGEPTAGKACSDTKVMAVLNPKDNTIYSLSVPPASLKNLAAYFGQLKTRRVAPGAVVTYVGFDPTADHQKLTFKAGKFIPQKFMETLAARCDTPEVEQIINPIAGVPATKQVEQGDTTGVVAGSSEEAPDEQVAVEEAPPEKPKAKPKAKAKAKPKVEAEEEPAAEASADDGDSISDDDLASILSL
jgi:hypothetical protein